MLGMGCATVCRALEVVSKLRAILILRCKKCNRVFSSNSYHLMVECKGEIRTDASVSVLLKGAPCFSSILIVPLHMVKRNPFKFIGMLSFFINNLRT